MHIARLIHHDGIEVTAGSANMVSLLYHNDMYKVNLTGQCAICSARLRF